MEEQPINQQNNKVKFKTKPPSKSKDKKQIEKIALICTNSSNDTDINVMDMQNKNKTIIEQQFKTQSQKISQQLQTKLKIDIQSIEQGEANKKIKSKVKKNKVRKQNDRNYVIQSKTYYKNKTQACINNVSEQLFHLEEQQCTHEAKKQLQEISEGIHDKGLTDVGRKVGIFGGWEDSQLDHKQKYKILTETDGDYLRENNVNQQKSPQNINKYSFSYITNHAKRRIKTTQTLYTSQHNHRSYHPEKYPQTDKNTICKIVPKFDQIDNNNICLSTAINMNIQKYLHQNINLKQRHKKSHSNVSSMSHTHTTPNSNKLNKNQQQMSTTLIQTPFFYYNRPLNKRNKQRNSTNHRNFNRTALQKNQRQENIYKRIKNIVNNKDQIQLSANKPNTSQPTQRSIPFNKTTYTQKQTQKPTTQYQPKKVNKFYSYNPNLNHNNNSIEYNTQHKQHLSLTKQNLASTTTRNKIKSTIKNNKIYSNSLITKQLQKLKQLINGEHFHFIQMGSSCPIKILGMRKLKDNQQSYNNI